MTTIRLDVLPSFHPSCYFQIDIQLPSSNLIFQINSGDNMKSEIRIDNLDKIGEIEHLAKKIIDETAQDTRIILDGVSLRCLVSENGVDKAHEFRCPQFGTNELKLVNDFFGIVQEYIRDQKVINYVELIEGYFIDNLPVKIFEEIPLRLRIYGTLSIDEKVGLTAMINKVLSRDEIIVDMTNFIGMGTRLYDCFKPLNNIPKLTFLANKNAVMHIEAMGFDKKMITQID